MNAIGLTVTLCSTFCPNKYVFLDKYRKKDNNMIFMYILLVTEIKYSHRRPIKNWLHKNEKKTKMTLCR